MTNYVENELEPGLVADANGSLNNAVEYYNAGGTKDTFAEVITHSRAGQATMTDSDGNLKWAPHNLLTYSEDVNTGWTLLDFASTTDNLLVPNTSNTYHYILQSAPSSVYDFTWEFEAKPEGYNFVRLFNSIIGIGVDIDLANKTFSGKSAELADPVITDGADGYVHVQCEYIGTRTNKTFALRPMPSALGSATFAGDGVSGVRVRQLSMYRSDLGGMVDNPDRSDSYVPTTSSAVYLPRRNHHVYNGDAWVNEGIFHESEARTNLVTYSQDFTDASWTKSNTGTLALDAVGPDGQANSAVTLVDSGATGTGVVLIDSSSLTVSTSTNYTISIFAKADQLSWMRLGARNFTSNAEAWFDLSTGSVGTTAGAQLVTQGIEDCGNGWYRCHVVFTSDAADTTGNIRIVVGDGDNDATVDFDGTSSILIYGAQLEAGSTPSSYIPTSGASSSRAAETLTIPAANLPWPEPNVIGSELVSHPLPTLGEWVYDGSGSYTVTSATANTDLRHNTLVTSGQIYEYQFTITGDTATVYLGNTTPENCPAGTYTRTVVANNNYLIFRATVGETITVSDISVKEIDPLSVSIQMAGRMTYADEGSSQEVMFANWLKDGSNFIQFEVDTSSTFDGRITFRQRETVSGLDFAVGSDVYDPGVLVPYNIASRHGSTFINGATDGTALTANTTPTALPDLSATDLELGYDYMGTISEFRIWAADIADAGLVDASSPSTVPSLLLAFDGRDTSSFTILDWEQ